MMVTVPAERLNVDAPLPVEGEAWLSHLNPAQRQAVGAPVGGAINIMAGAGTGKTTVMAHRVVAVWLAAIRQAMATAPHGRLDDDALFAIGQQVLAVTFTIKAAEEMRTRVQHLIATHAAMYTDDPAWQALQAMMMTHGDAVWIHHFHGVGRRLLLRHGASMGWGPGFTVLEPTQQKQCLAALLLDCQQGRLDDCSDALHHAGLQDEISPLVLSPKVLQRTIPRQINQVLDDALQLIGRIKSAGLGPKGFFHTVGQQTHAFTQHIMATPQQGALDAGFDDYTDYGHAIQQHWQPYATPGWQSTGTATERHQAMERRLKNTPTADPSDWAPIDKELVDACTAGPRFMMGGEAVEPFGKFNRKRWVPGMPAAALQHQLLHIDAEEQALVPVVAALYAVLQYRLYVARACDFDDLILHPIQLLQRSPKLQAAYHQQFCTRVVDEFQDTNGSQLTLVRLLTPPQHPGLMVVGDIKQAIYGFRYAQPENMTHVFKGVQPAPQCIHLSENYRSSPSILAVANGAANQLAMPNPVALTTSKTEAMAVQHVLLIPQVDDSADDAEDNDAPEPVMADYQQAEARWIASTIRQLRDDEKVPLRDVAILARSHAAGLRMARALQQVGVASNREQGDASLWHTPALRQLMALLGVLSNPSSDADWVCLLQEKLNHAQLRELARLKKNLEQQQVNASPKNSTRTDWRHTLQTVADTTTLPHWPVPLRTAVVGLVETVLAARIELTHGDWLPQVLALAETLGVWPAECVPEAISIWRDWVTALQVSLPYKRFTLRQWVATFTQCREDGMGLPTPPPPTDEAVTILTMHAAKGLEYPVVFVSAVDLFRKRGGEGLIDMEPRFTTGEATQKDNTSNGFGLFWRKHHRYWHSKTQLTTLKKHLVDTIWRSPRQAEETRRLFYVALTRAKQRLTILRCPKSPVWTNPETLVASTSAAVYTVQVAVSASNSPVEEPDNQAEKG